METVSDMYKKRPSFDRANAKPSTDCDTQQNTSRDSHLSVDVTRKSDKFLVFVQLRRRTNEKPKQSYRPAYPRWQHIYSSLFTIYGRKK